MSSTPTINDVAKAAGVSLSAVSFVLNGKADKFRISPTTQARIRAAITQLGFKPNPDAIGKAHGEHHPHSIEVTPFEPITQPVAEEISSPEPEIAIENAPLGIEVDADVTAASASEVDLSNSTPVFISEPMPTLAPVESLQVPDSEITPTPEASAPTPESTPIDTPEQTLETGMTSPVSEPLPIASIPEEPVTPPPEPSTVDTPIPAPQPAVTPETAVETGVEADVPAASAPEVLPQAPETITASTPVSEVATPTETIIEPTPTPIPNQAPVVESPPTQPEATPPTAISPPAPAPEPPSESAPPAVPTAVTEPEIQTSQEEHSGMQTEEGTTLELPEPALEESLNPPQ